MSADVAVLVPVLNRPARALPLAESVAGSRLHLELELVFVVTAGDELERAAVQAACARAAELELSARELVAPWPVIRGDYARKINLGLWQTSAPHVFCGADDLRFERGWADHCVDVSRRRDVCFVGTNDLSNPRVMKGLHATHPLVCRDYALECGTIDTPGAIYHEGYWHQYVDNEATETAVYRGCFGFAEGAIVEHMHPIFPKPGRRVPLDETYRLGQLHTAEDKLLWRARRPLWEGTGS